MPPSDPGLTVEAPDLSEELAYKLSYELPDVDLANEVSSRGQNGGPLGLELGGSRRPLGIGWRLRLYLGRPSGCATAVTGGEVLVLAVALLGYLLFGGGDGKESVFVGGGGVAPAPDLTWQYLLLHRQARSRTGTCCSMARHLSINSTWKRIWTRKIWSVSRTSYMTSSTIFRAAAVLHEPDVRYPAADTDEAEVLLRGHREAVRQRDLRVW